MGTSIADDSRTAINGSSDTSLDALNRHYKDDYEDLCALARNIVACPHTAEDIVQQAFANTSAFVIERGGQIDEIEYWLKRVVRNLALTHISAAKTFTLIDEHLSDVCSRPEERARLNRGCRKLYEAVKELPEEQRSVFTLAEIYGLDRHEIALTMKRSRVSTQGLLQRARENVRKSMSLEDLALVPPLLGVRGSNPIASLVDRVTAKFTALRNWLASIGDRLTPFHCSSDTVLSALVCTVAATTLFVAGGPSARNDAGIEASANPKYSTLAVINGPQRIEFAGRKHDTDESLELSGNVNLRSTRDRSRGQRKQRSDRFAQERNGRSESLVSARTDQGRVQQTGGSGQEKAPSLGPAACGRCGLPVEPEAANLAVAHGASPEVKAGPTTTDFDINMDTGLHPLGEPPGDGESGNDSGEGRFTSYGGGGGPGAGGSSAN